MLRRSRADWTMLLALVGLWGSSFALIKVALETLPPLTIAGFRLAIAAAALFAIAARRGDRIPTDARAVLWMAWLGMTGSGIPGILLPLGQRHIDTGLAGILVAATPLFVAVLAHRVLPGERITPSRLFGLVLGFAGVAVLFAPAIRIGASPDAAFVGGALAIVGAALGYAVRGVSAGLAPAFSPIAKAAGAMLAAALLTLPAAMVVDGLPRAATPASICAIIVLGLGANALSEVLVFRLVASAGPGFTMLSNYLIPLWAMSLGVVAFDERPPITALAALGLIVVGIWLSERVRRTPVDLDGRRPDNS